MKRLKTMRTRDCVPCIRWHVQRTSERMGRSGMMSVIFMTGLFVCQSGLVTPQFETLSEQKTGLLNELEKPHGLRSDENGKTTSAMVDVKKINTIAQQMMVLEILKDAGLEIKESVYRKETEVKGKLARWTMNITAKGRYRDFSEATRALGKQPLVRIDAVALERSRIEDVTLNIDLQVSVLGEDR